MGIIVYILLNNINRFSIGVSYSISTKNILTGEKITIRKINFDMYLPVEVFDLSVESTGGVGFTDLDNYLDSDHNGSILKPIYLGSYEKSPTEGFVWPERKFIIIDKKLYYFKEVSRTNGFLSEEYTLLPSQSGVLIFRRGDLQRSALLCKNYGEPHSTPPLFLVNDTRSASATLGVIETLEGWNGKFSKFRITCCVDQTATYEISGYQQANIVQLRQNLITYKFYDETDHSFKL